MHFLRKRPLLNIMLGFFATVHAAFWVLLSLASLVTRDDERIFEEMSHASLLPLLIGSSALTAVAFYIITWCRFSTFCGVILFTASLQLLLVSI
jgi:UDP-N-acetylmuramyl pentapeptide phosphotransferase/UDP-N-acetylglucosamine-1-phosphate transferase